MKRIALAIACCAPVAAACPVKAGYIANGTFKNTFSTERFAPVCGEMRAYLAQNVFTTMRWTELYGVKNDSSGTVTIETIQALLMSKGYRLVGKQNTSKGQMFRFDMGARTVMMMTAYNDPIILVGIAGK